MKIYITSFIKKIQQEIRQIDGYHNYIAEQCWQDLQSLVDWGNMTTMQHSYMVRTVKDFKNQQPRLSGWFNMEISEEAASRNFNLIF
ncbi:MAG: DUF2397 family protein [Beduini sp.]|uniref:DUF2397 family protein n=1 Tax=Beduini sp. TaxID=1922300 RepID=UPI0011C705E7